MNTVIGGKASKAALFNTIGGWTTQFEIEGQKVGGTVDLLPKDPRLLWHLEQIGGAEGKTVLELGALEGAHTKMLHDAGARLIMATEGLNDCFLRCLVVKEAFYLTRARFFFCDFNDYVASYPDAIEVLGAPKFDFVSAAGVLYHQKDPVTLIRNLARITDTVLVWSQVADATQPAGKEGTVNGYRGKWNNYNGTRLTSASYCGGLQNDAFWLYGNELIRCFYDAGFRHITRGESPRNVNGESLLFVASKNPL